VSDVLLDISTHGINTNIGVAFWILLVLFYITRKAWRYHRGNQNL